MSEHAAASAITAQTAEQRYAGIPSSNLWNAADPTTSGVLVKLLVLTFALAFAPLTFYYISRDYFWNGDSTFAAITAVIAANVVLAGYIFLSMQEERQAANAAKAENNQTTPPETKKTQ